MTHDPSQPMLTGSEGPEALTGRVVVESVSCERCSYDLRGLAATGACPECGRSVQSSLARWIDPEFHHLPRITNPRAVAFGLRWLANWMTLSVLAWTIGTVLTQLPFLMLDNSAASTALLPAWIRHSVELGSWCILAAPVCAVLATPALFALAPLRCAQQTKKAWSIIYLFAFGLLLWSMAMVLQQWIAPGQGLHLLVRSTTDAGRSGHWEIFSLLLTLSPLPGGWLLLFGVRSLLGELGKRSRIFRTATSKRQYVLDLIWATLFWTGGIVLQFGGGGLGVSLPVTCGSILRLVAGGFVLVGVLYLWLNLRWIASPLAVPPPRLRSLLSPMPGADQAPASSAGNAPPDSSR